MTNSVIWRCVKSGRSYIVIDWHALIEATKELAVVYRSVENGQVWVLPYKEFMDGRFIRVSCEDVRSFFGKAP